MPTHEALRLAQERGYDLVEVAPMAAPPVVRFLDFGQYKYELTKREKEAKRKQRSVTFKEVRLKPKIGIGDFDTKVRRAIEFLEEGDRIKVAVQFRGRELTHPEIGRNLLTRFADQIKEHGVVERAPLLEGKSMHITVASVHKPKSQEGPAARRLELTSATPGNRRRQGPATWHQPRPRHRLHQHSPVGRGRAGPAAAASGTQLWLRRGVGTGRRRNGSGSARGVGPGGGRTSAPAPAAPAAQAATPAPLRRRPSRLRRTAATRPASDGTGSAAGSANNDTEPQQQIRTAPAARAEQAGESA